MTAVVTDPLVFDLCAGLRRFHATTDLPLDRLKKAQQTMREAINGHGDIEQAMNESIEAMLRDTP